MKVPGCSVGMVVANCMACNLVEDPAALPGGQIAVTEYWVIEHCIGPLDLGTLILKPKRHVTAVADLADEETTELGPLLRRCSQLAATLTGAEQVYDMLWSHADGVPGHVHYVIQPVTRAQV